MRGWNHNSTSTNVVALRGDIAKDDTGAYSVFTEQGSSASQMTAAKVVDVLARLPECAGHAADAVSAYTQVKMEDAPRLLTIPKSKCPDFWIRLPRHKLIQILVRHRGPSRSSCKKLVRTPSCRTHVGETVRRSFVGTWMGKKVPNWECFFVHRKQKLILSVYVDDIEVAGKKQNKALMWKMLMKKC